MKKSLWILLFLLVTPKLFAEPLKIFACEPEWGALAKALTQGLATPTSIEVATSAYDDPHHIDARPTLISRVRRADVVFCTGAELESGWLPVLLQRAANPRVLQAPGLFYAADQVTLLGKPAKLDRAEGDIHGAGNPHVHLDPRNLLKIAQAFSARLQQVDAVNAAVYQQALTTFENDWQQRIQQWEAQASRLNGRKVVVYHDGWLYLRQWLGLELAGTIEPKPGIPPSARHLAELADGLREKPVYRIITSHYQDARAAERLSRMTGVCAQQLPFTVGVKGIDTLASLFDQLVAKLVAPCAEGGA